MTSAGTSGSTSAAADAALAKARRRLIPFLFLTASTLSTGVAWSIVTLSVAIVGLGSMFGPFWALTTAATRGVGAAAAIALVNSVGNTGGFVGPYLLGAINEATQSFAAGLIAIAVMLIAGGALVLTAREA